MNIDFTHHAAKRCQQRAIPPFVVELVMRFGRREKAGDGLEKVFLDQPARKAIKRYVGPTLVATLENHLDVYVVVGSGETVITAAHRIKRIKHH